MESSADMVIFIDDDVSIQRDSVRTLLSGIVPFRSGVVGAAAQVAFPRSTDVWHEATRMSGILLAFDWPPIRKDCVPWCVTACMAVWRRFAPMIDEAYSKTGGGEDVDFCLRAIEKARPFYGPWVSNIKSEDAWRFPNSLPVFIKVDNVGVEHPFWKREAGLSDLFGYLCHFFKWTQGDGRLLDRFPEHTYVCLPNAIEATLPVLWLCGIRGVVVLWVIETLCEAVAAMECQESAHLAPAKLLQAAMRSGAVKNVVDLGHACWYWVRRLRFEVLCWRFDWFCGLTRDVVDGERRKFLKRWVVWLVCLHLTRAR